MKGNCASSWVVLGYTNQFCVPEVTAVFFSSCDSVVGDFLELLSPASHVGGTGGLFSSLFRLCWPSQTSGQLTRLNGAPPGGWPWSLCPAWAFVLVSGPWLDPLRVRRILQWPLAEGGARKGDAGWWGGSHAQLWGGQWARRSHCDCPLSLMQGVALNLTVVTLVFGYLRFL